MTGLSPAHELRQLLDKQLRPVELPPEGLLLSSKLAEILAVSPGDMVTLEVLEGARGVYQVPVAGLVDEMLGLGAYMDARALGRLLREDNNTSGAHLRLQGDDAQRLYAELKRMPAVGGVAVRSAMQASLQDTLNRSFSFFSMILAVFACIIVGGMVYNSLRIALAERGNRVGQLVRAGLYAA